MRVIGTYTTLLEVEWLLSWTMFAVVVLVSVGNHLQACNGRGDALKSDTEDDKVVCLINNNCFNKYWLLKRKCNAYCIFIFDML